MVEQAPGPKEIIWEHLRHFSSKPYRIAVGWGLSALFLFLILILFYFVSLWKANLLEKAEE